MTTSQKATEERLVWKPVPGVQAVVFIAKTDDRPVAIIELRPGHGFHATMCNGENVGQFHSLVDGQAAVDDWLRTHQRV